jgi:hypothetical protein
MDRRRWVCERLQKLGYAKGNFIRLYGRDLCLISDPIADDDGYCVDTIERRSGAVQRTSIPLMVAKVVEEEIATDEDLLAV